MKKNFVSNSSESIRMFKSGFLESLSKVSFYVPLIVYVPVIIYLCWKSLFELQMGWLNFVGYLLFGLFVWTFTEYILHRFVFHFYPTSEWGKKIHFIFHGVHHDYPNDAKRLVMPPSASIPLALAFYYLFLYILPAGTNNAFFIGFIGGYLVYDMTHYALHHANFKNGFWKKLKQHHMLHHYSDSTKGYGVSSDIWDRVLGSNFLKKKDA
ncbi:sterol desaturase family protein [Pedobacter nutrimenti]|uniref:sterol desaturase family protein n=1 Tax=Pedobacter nutrimenti TaxID=1241337 RepID=UPI002930295D|nr:sterol desaturase family protein [Pedobacter nutrimenti]